MNSTVKCNEGIHSLSNNTLNSRKQAFWKYYWSEQISNFHAKLLKTIFTPRFMESRNMVTRYEVGNIYGNSCVDCIAIWDSYVIYGSNHYYVTI